MSSSSSPCGTVNGTDNTATGNAVAEKASSTQSHYEAHSASSYESAFFYSPGEYTNYLADLVSNRLALIDGSNANYSRRRFLDIGGGTGNFTRLLLERATNVEAVVVDPFLPATQEEGDADHVNIRFVKETAESFSSSDNNDEWWRRNYHQVLMKEVVHHLGSSARVDIFRGIHQGLEPISSNDKDKHQPSLLIVTRPQFDVDYPLWKEAREVWAENQPSLESIQQDLITAGFTKTEHTVESYPCSIPMTTWLDMVQGRFWSTFSNFSDAELRQACDKLQEDEAHRIDKDGRIRFEDRLLLISAFK